MTNWESGGGYTLWSASIRPGYMTSGSSTLVGSALVAIVLRLGQRDSEREGEVGGRPAQSRLVGRLNARDKAKDMIYVGIESLERDECCVVWVSGYCTSEGGDRETRDLTNGSGMLDATRCIHSRRRPGCTGAQMSGHMEHVTGLHIYISHKTSFTRS